MAWFKKRKGGEEPVAPPSPTESIEAMRRRARHRLIGAVVLVLAGVIGFPLLFDTQPRPVAVDIPIEIPDRNKVKPLPVPAPSAAPKASAPAVAAAPAPAAVPAPASASPASAPAPAETVVKAPAPIIDEPAEKKSEPKPKADAKPAPPKPAAADDGEKARALLEGKAVDAGGRFVVQVGAFAELDKAREARQKVERAGLKTYTNVAETKDGRRIRVRAGPFTSRAEAEKAAEKIKGLDLPAAILTL